MRQTTQKFLFYLGYVFTMIIMIAAAFFIWNIPIYPMLKILILLPLVYISALLTLSLDEGFTRKWS